MVFVPSHSFASSNVNAPPSASNPSSVVYPSQNELQIPAADPTIKVTFTLSVPTTVDIGINDQYLIGDEYSVTLNGNPLFTTTTVSQPGSYPSAIQTNYSGCDLATAHSDGLSVGDSTVSLVAGTYTLVIKDVSSAFFSIEQFSPAGLCLSLEPPPSFSVPQFPLGTGLIIGFMALIYIVMNMRLLPKKQVLH